MPLSCLPFPGHLRGPSGLFTVRTWHSPGKDGAWVSSFLLRTRLPGAVPEGAGQVSPASPGSGRLGRPPQAHLKGSDSCTSRAAPRIRPSLSAWAKAFSSTSPPRAAFTRKAPCLICGGKQSGSAAGAGSRGSGTAGGQGSVSANSETDTRQEGWSCDLSPVCRFMEARPDEDRLLLGPGPARGGGPARHLARATQALLTGVRGQLPTPPVLTDAAGPEDVRSGYLLYGKVIDEVVVVLVEVTVQGDAVALIQ